MVDGRVSWDSKIAESWEGLCLRIVIFQQHDAGEFTLITRAALVRSFISTTPVTVSANRYADLGNVSTATLTPSLLTSYDAN
jgi:hypothetical protein